MRRTTMESTVGKTVRVTARKPRLQVGDEVTLKNGRKGSVLELGSTQFCIDYDDGSGAEWVPNSSVASVR